LGERDVALLDGEQQAETEREDRTDRRQAGASGVASRLAADRRRQPGDGER
jgi:hypothetical protein